MHNLNKIKSNTEVIYKKIKMLELHKHLFSNQLISMLKYRILKNN